MAVFTHTIVASPNFEDAPARAGCSTTLAGQATTTIDLLVNQVDIRGDFQSAADALNTPLFDRDLTCLHLRITAYEKYSMENQSKLSQLASGDAFHEAIARELRADQKMLQEGLKTARAELLRNHGVHHTGEAWTIGLTPCQTTAISAPIDTLGYYQDSHGRENAHAGRKATSSAARAEKRKRHPLPQMAS